MESEDHTSLVARRGNEEETVHRRHCGCIKTSEKLKQLLKQFPGPPPPSPNLPYNQISFGPALCTICARAFQPVPYITQKPFKQDALVKSKKDKQAFDEQMQSYGEPAERDKVIQTSTRYWVVGELVQLLQLSVMATALVLYYFIYCYMQLVYFMLRSALYFHNADRAMKVTIGVVTLSALVLGFNLLLRFERILGILS